MKQRLLLIFLICVLQACAATDLKTEKNKSIPKWVNNPYALCSTDEMCAVGTGLTRNRSKTDARSELAKIFESKIKASFETVVTERNNNAVLNIRDYISDESDVILQSVEIKETFETPDEIFSLAVLNKPTATRITKQDLDKLDEKMHALLNEDTPAAAVQLEKLYEERYNINRRYTVLTGRAYAEKISYEQVYNNKKARTGKHHIFLTVEGNTPPSFAQTVRTVLTENGYTFADTASEKTPKVIISLKKEKQPLNISGFVKYSYLFTMKGPDKNGVMTDVFATTIEETGRNEKQAYTNALTSLKTYLTQNILNLNF